MNKVKKDEVAISLPFSIDPYGKVSQTKDQSKIWADKVRSVVGTAVNERVMRPLFGTDIPLAIFENQDSAADIVQDLVTTSFNTQLPRLDLQSVNTAFDSFTGTINLEIIYALPNEEVVSTTIGFIALSGNLIPYEENL
jgi:phage baseplate assembly protein W